MIKDPDSEVDGANMGPIWGRQDPGGPILAPWTLLFGEERCAMFCCGYNIISYWIRVKHLSIFFTVDSRVKRKESTNHFLTKLLLLLHIRMKSSWWRHQMEIFFVLLATCVRTSPVPGDFLAQRPVTRSFDVFFDLRPNKLLSKQSWGWWFETPSCPLWRHRNGRSGWQRERSIQGWVSATISAFDIYCTFL